MVLFISTGDMCAVCASRSSTVTTGSRPLSMLYPSTGVATAILLIAAHDRPFIGEISVSPDPLLQVMPQPEGWRCY